MVPLFKEFHHRQALGIEPRGLGESENEFLASKVRLPTSNFHQKDVLLALTIHDHAIHLLHEKWSGLNDVKMGDESCKLP